MAYALLGEIIFPASNGRREFKIRRFSSVKIEKSWHSLTDTAEITIPRKTRDFDRFKTSSWFREGDPVEIKLGYGATPIREFIGYITDISIGIPLVLKLENEMYKLKRKTLSISIKECTLRTLLRRIAPGYVIRCEKKDLGSVLYEKKTVSEILDDLKKNGISTWFDDKILYSFSESKSELSPVPVSLENSVSETLKQKAAEKTLVTVSLLRKVGRKIKVEYGDKGAGRKINREYSGISKTRDELVAEAKEVYQKAMTPELDGDVTLFGVPALSHGRRVSLSSWLYPEKNGMYYVDSVTKTFGGNGYRQVCKLGKRAL